MSSRSDARRQAQPRRPSLESSGTNLGGPLLPMRASRGESPESGATAAASAGYGPVWRRSREEGAGYGRYATERRGISPEQEGVHREHIRSSHWQPQPLRLPRNRRDAEYRRTAADEDTGERHATDPGKYPRSIPGKSPKEGFGNGSVFRGSLYAPSLGEEPDDTAAHAAVQHLERLHAEVQLLDELKSMSQAGETVPDRDLSQCVYYSPRANRYKRTPQPGLPPLPEAPEARAARHDAMAERVCRLLTETHFELSTLSIVSDASSGSGPGAERQPEPRTSAAVVRAPEPSRSQDATPRPGSHRRPARTPAPARPGAQALRRAPSGEPQSRQGQQPEPEQPPFPWPPPPGPATPKTQPADAGLARIPTKTAFSKRANKKAGWRVQLPPGHSTRRSGLFNPPDQMLERQRRARLAHALHARHHTGATPPLRGEWYRQELARVAEEVAQAQDDADRTSVPPAAGGGGGEDEGGEGGDTGARASRRRRRARLQEPGARPAGSGAAAAAVWDDDAAAAAAAPREPCAGCHQAKRRAKKPIRKYGFCPHCLQKHLVNLGELRSCPECRRLRVKEDYFLYDKHGAPQPEARVCAFCRWRKKGKCEFLCGRPD